MYTYGRISQFYQSDINLPLTQQHILQYYNTHLVQTQDEILGETTHSFGRFVFPKIHSL